MARPTRTWPDAEAWLVGGATALIVLVYALRNGTYDVVARGESGVLIWLALGIGWLTGVLPRTHLPKVAWCVAGGFALLALWTAMSLSWTISEERTMIELGRVLHHAGVFLLAASILTRRTWVAALAGVTLAMVIVAWLGLCNWLWPGSIAVDHARAVFDVHRLTYPLDYWNGMAALGAMATVACVAWATHAETAWMRGVAALPVPGVALSTYLTYSRGGAFELGIGLLALLALAAGRWAVLIEILPLAGASVLAIFTLRGHSQLVQGTGSDGVGGVMLILIVGGLVGAAVATALWRSRATERLRLPRRPARIAFGATVLALVVAAGVAGPAVYRHAKHSYNTAETGSAANPTARFTNLGGGRNQQYPAALEVWQDHPFEGTGPGTWEFDWNQSPRYTGFVRDVHNIYLQALAESGWPGLLALLILLVGAAVVAGLAVVHAEDPARRGAAAAAAAVLATFLFAAGIDWMWELTVIPVIALIGVGAATASMGAERGAIGRRAWIPRGGVAIAALVAVLVILPPVVSRSQIRKSQASARAGHPVAALRHADDAIQTAPWSPTAMAQKALLLEAAGQLDAAQGYATLAYRREPQNWRYALLRARLLARRDDVRHAIAWYKRAQQLAPKNPNLP